MPCNRTVEGEDICVHEEQEDIRRLMRPQKPTEFPPPREYRPVKQPPLEVPVTVKPREADASCR